ncbi:MAG: hypothetical protein ACLQVK_25760 [Acidimicrobiales bacterium]
MSVPELHFPPMSRRGQPVYSLLGPRRRAGAERSEVTPAPAAGDLVGDLRLARSAGGGRLVPQTSVTGVALHFGAVELGEARRYIRVEENGPPPSASGAERRSGNG